MAKSRHLNTSKFNYWAFITSSLILLSLIVFSLIWFQKQKDASAWVTHTYQVKLEIEKCFGLLLEAESNQRGFLLNNDSAFLKNIHHAESLLYPNLEQLGYLIIDNSDQVQNVKSLKLLVAARIERMHALLDSPALRNKISVSYPVSPGKAIMDSIHNKVRLMETQEDRLLKQRIFFKKTQDNWIIIFILSFSALAFTTLMWSFFKMRTENKLRLQAQYDADLLDGLVNERTTEINHINSLLTEQNIKLERKNRDLMSFTNIASHDLKEPLRKISMFVTMIGRSNPELLSEESGYFNKISSSAKRMQILIDSILQYAQTDDDNAGFQDTNLNETANLAIESLSEKIKEKNATVKVQPLPTIFCNPSQIEQLFINFMDNGLKYSRPGVLPILEIDAQLEETGKKGGHQIQSWQINFRDNGIGFEEAYREKIFEIFQRLHANDEYPGTGIGLAICKKIAENHHGQIIVKSVLGEGSVFSVILPVNKTLTHNA